MKAQPPSLLSDCQILIVGLGLMGGSLALSLQGKCKSLLGVEINEKVSKFAVENKFVNEVYTDFQVLPPVDLVILAIPVGAIIQTLSEMGHFITQPVVVMDTGSTKQAICKAMENLDEQFDPIGGHPMCGKERLGIQNADPNIFSDAPFAMVPLERTSERAKNLVSQLVHEIGSKGIWLDALTHDRWVAAVSHVPYLLASALTLGTPLESSMLIGSGFRSSARLAATPTSMMADVLMTNRDPILHSMEKVEDEWHLLYKMLADHQDGALIEYLDQAALRLSSMLKGDTKG